MDVAPLLLELYGRIEPLAEEAVDDLDASQLAASPGEGRTPSRGSCGTSPACRTTTSPSSSTRSQALGHGGLGRRGGPRARPAEHRVRPHRGAGRDDSSARRTSADRLPGCRVGVHPHVPRIARAGRPRSSRRPTVGPARHARGAARERRGRLHAARRPGRVLRGLLGATDAVVRSRLAADEHDQLRLLVRVVAHCNPRAELPALSKAHRPSAPSPRTCRARGVGSRRSSPPRCAGQVPRVQEHVAGAEHVDALLDGEATDLVLELAFAIAGSSSTDCIAWSSASQAPSGSSSTDGAAGIAAPTGSSTIQGIHSTMWRTMPSCATHPSHGAGLSHSSGFTTRARAVKPAATSRQLSAIGLIAGRT